MAQSTGSETNILESMEQVAAEYEEEYVSPEEIVGLSFPKCASCP